LWRDVHPTLAAIASDLDLAVVSASPDEIDVLGRGRDGIDHAALRGFGSGLAAEDTDSCRHRIILAGEIRRDLLPTIAAICGLPESVGGEEEHFRIDGREDDGLCAHDAKILRAEGARNDVLRLRGATVIARELAAIHNVRIERIRDHIAVFFGGNRVPFANGDLAIVSSAGDAGRAALLLATAEAIGKSIVQIG